MTASLGSVLILFQVATDDVAIAEGTATLQSTPSAILHLT